MRNPDQLVHSRVCVEPNFALMPLEGFPPSRLPGWSDCDVFVLASPALGAGFVQYLVDVPAGVSGRVMREDDLETFYYVLEGQGEFTCDREQDAALRPGSFGLVAPGSAPHFSATSDLRLLVLNKRYEPSPDFPEAKSFFGNVDGIAAETWGDNPSSRLQTLIPDDLAFDMAMNIFTFDPGCGLPIVETHVMEHGLLFVEGRGLYFLGGRWMEVESSDFIWMGPFCPQSFYATGPTPSRYLYYKNVNREVSL